MGVTAVPQTRHTDQQHRAILRAIAHRAMLERGLLPDFSVAALAELDRIQAPADVNAEPLGGPSGMRDLTDLPWASIDNDDSRDLDQLTVAETLPEDRVKIRVAVADVDALVKNSAPIDEHARHNTTSVYTAAEIFPMLPEKLSTDLTSLNFDEERPAVVVEMIVAGGRLLARLGYLPGACATMRRLAYNSVAAWLDEDGALPEGIAAVNGSAIGRLACSCRLRGWLPCFWRQPPASSPSFRRCASLFLLGSDRLVYPPCGSGLLLAPPAVPGPAC